MKRGVSLFLVLVFGLLLLAGCGAEPVPSESAKPVPEGIVDVTWETGAVSVSYYEGAEITRTEQDGDLQILVPQGVWLEELNIFAPEGKVEVVGVMAARYDIETVGDDINIYLPEGTAFHVMLSTISDIFESDFPYDVTMTRHEYLYLTDGVEIVLETIIGVARVMQLQ